MTFWYASTLYRFVLKFILHGFVPSFRTLFTVCFLSIILARPTQTVPTPKYVTAQSHATAKYRSKLGYFIGLSLRLLIPNLLTYVRTCRILNITSICHELTARKVSLVVLLGWSPSSPARLSKAGSVPELSTSNTAVSLCSNCWGPVVVRLSIPSSA
jgi:hypothetical protein